MSEPLPLTYAEWVHLVGVKAFCGSDKYNEMTGGYRTTVLSSLVRKGLVASREQSEQVRGEPRTRWRIYKITTAGLKRLESSANVRMPNP